MSKNAPQEIDPDAIPDGPPPPLEDGLYFVVFESAESEETSKGDPAIKLELQVTHAYGGSPGDLRRKVFDKAVYTQESGWRMKQLAKAAGVELPRTNSEDDLEDLCASLLDSPGAYVRLRQQTYKGKTNARVDRYCTEEQAALVASGGDPDSPEGSGGGETTRKGRRRRKG